MRKTQIPFQAINDANCQVAFCWLLISSRASKGDQQSASYKYHFDKPRFNAFPVRRKWGQNSDSAGNELIENRREFADEINGAEWDLEGVTFVGDDGDGCRL